MIKKPILYILAGALLIRLVAINHGFPLIIHPDEPTVVRSALGIRFDPNPHHFDWPHLYIYLNYFVYMIFAKLRDLITLWGLKPSVAQVAPIIFNDNLIFYLITRVFSAVLGALTAIPLYLWVKKLINKNAGLVSSAFLTLAPLHVRYSHYTLVDIPMLFFLSWSLFFATFSPILSGLFLGFSASTKYNGIFGALFIFPYYLLTKRKFGDFVKTGVFTILGFVLGTPFSIIDFKTFIRTDGPQGALWQFTNLGKVRLPEHIYQFINALVIKLPENTGYVVIILFTIGLVYLLASAVKRKTVNRIIVLCVLIFLYIVYYISGGAKDRSHYFFILYPYLFLVSGWMLENIVDKVRKVSYKIAIIILVLLPSLVLSALNISDLVSRGDIKEDVKIKP